jgi:hypothetical protein
MKLTQPISTPAAAPEHIDDWIDFAVSNTDKSLHYAAFVLDFARRPAMYKFTFNKWMNQFKLFATWKDRRYRVTGASRMGDVWLAEDFNRETGYDHRVNVNELSLWADKP